MSPGRHRGPSIKHDRLVSTFARINFDPQTDEIIRNLAELEQRSFGNMIAVLVREALLARAGRTP